MSLGTRTWGRSTGGRLSLADRLVFAAQGVEAIVRARWDRSQSPRSIELAALPTSPEANAATAFCAEVSEPWLVNHCTRTYLWGAMLAQRDGLTFDPDLFAVTCMLHDLGLAKPIRARRTEACFAVAGAEEAALFASRELEWTDVRCGQLAEAISLHLNLIVTKAQGVEAHLLHEGAGFDVVAARRRQIPEPLRTRVIELHPRLNQNHELAEVCAHEAEVNPQTRLGFSFRRFGARTRIERCPL